MTEVSPHSPNANKSAPPTLPIGVALRPLRMLADDRGVLVEIFRAAWPTGITPVQWNFVSSQAGVLRGVHVHIIHTDYLVLLQGRTSVGLRDLRPGSPTEGMTALVELHGEELAALTIPPGVAHGFFFHEPSLHIYAVSHYWNPEDELGCHWADPALELPWPMPAARVSERDAALPPLRELLNLIPPFVA